MKVSTADFPIREETIYLNNCGVAPLFGPAARAMSDFVDSRSRLGAGVFRSYGTMSADLRREAARLLDTSEDNVAFTKNTAEGLSMLANGYPFRSGDEIISYTHEYPSNHYPWTMQERRGVRIRLLPDSRVGLSPSAGAEGPPDKLPGPCAWSMDDLHALANERTRIIALSHVQFTSGFAADLEQLGAFCAARGIDLVIDAAQSLGCLPVYPERWNVAAVACSGWKWLLGPLGSGLFYTSKGLRDRLAITMAGAEVVTQAPDYLDHRWQPHHTARKFEYSTAPAAGIVGLLTALGRLWNTVSPEDVRAHAFSLQERLLKQLDANLFRALLFDTAHRSGILSFVVKGDPDAFCRAATERGVFLTSRGGYVRTAPHVYLTLEDMDRAAVILNAVAAERPGA